jgi:hypothetical protein
MKKIVLLLLLIPFLVFAQFENKPEFFKINLQNASAKDLNKFLIKKDKFSNITTISFKKNDSKRLQFYIYEKEGIASFFLETSYYGSDWMFLKSITFLVDDKKYEFALGEVKRDVLYNSGVSEISGVYVNDLLYEALEKIANPESIVEVKYGGEKKNFDFKINKYMKQMVKETLDFYQLIKE